MLQLEKAQICTTAALQQFCINQALIIRIVQPQPKESMSIHSMTNIKESFGGMSGSRPFLPKARCGGMVTFRFSPAHMPYTPFSKPFMHSGFDSSLQVPSLNTYGSLESRVDANCFPLLFKYPV